MTITALPTPPSRNDPANFAERGDAFLAALPNFATQANALAADVNDKASTASTAANTASSKAGEAAASANTASTKAGEASGSATTAGNAATAASQSATQADGFRQTASDWAQKIGAAVVAGMYSAKEWAVGTFTRGTAGGGSAKDWATYTGGKVDDTEYSAKYYANQAASTLSGKANLSGADFTGPITTTSNAAIGTTLSVWNAASKVVQLPAGSIESRSSALGLWSNAYYSSGSNPIYSATGRAANFYINDGAYYWLTAASGTAGGAVSFSQAMALDNSGKLGVGGTPTSRLHVFEAAAAGSSASIALTNTQVGSGSVTLNLTSTGFTYGGVGGSETLLLAADSGPMSIATFAANPIKFIVNQVERARIDTAGSMTPGNDNAQTLGSAAKRWSTIYAGTGTINTSDAREKTSVADLTDAELNAAKSLAKEIGTYQFLASVTQKGDAARLHVGLTVQRAIEIMESFGLDPMRYGFICYDKWDAEYEDVLIKDGQPFEFEREMSRQATTMISEEQEEIELVDGVPVLKKKMVERAELLFKLVDVVSETGEVVMVVDAPATPAEVDDEGREIVPAMPATYKPLQHPVPVMETVKERFTRREVRSAGDRYSFRYDQLSLFIARGLAERLSAMENGGA